MNNENANIQFASVSDWATHYKDDILKLFKDKFIEQLNKGDKLDFDSITNKTLDLLGLEGSLLNDSSIAPLKSWFEKIMNLDALSSFLQASDCYEILIHSHEVLQMDTHCGLKSNKINGLSPEDFQLSLEVLAAQNHVAWNYSTPFQSFSAIIQGQVFRATLIHFSATPNGQSKLFLRRPANKVLTFENFALSAEAQTLIKKFIHQKKNILISGATGSGKTSFLQAMLSEVSASEHVIILEDTHELIQNNPNRTNLLADAECKNKSLKDYCAYAMRMRPDRIVVGEMRSHEVIPFLLSMNTGHKGLLSSIHANNAQEALSRMALLFGLYADQKDMSYELVFKLICNNIDIVIHLENKKVSEIIEVLGSEKEHSIVETLFPFCC